jgi:carbamoylphosphate synthase small subunit
MTLVVNTRPANVWKMTQTLKDFLSAQRNLVGVAGFDLRSLVSNWRANFPFGALSTKACLPIQQAAAMPTFVPGCAHRSLEISVIRLYAEL